MITIREASLDKNSNVFIKQDILSTVWITEEQEQEQERKRESRRYQRVLKKHRRDRRRQRRIEKLIMEDKNLRKHACHYIKIENTPIDCEELEKYVFYPPILRGKGYIFKRYASPCITINDVCFDDKDCNSKLKTYIAKHIGYTANDKICYGLGKCCLTNVPISKLKNVRRVCHKSYNGLYLSNISIPDGNIILEDSNLEKKFTLQEVLNSLYEHKRI